MTQTTMARPHAPRRSVLPVSVIVLFVVGALLCVGMAFALRDPEIVSRVTVTNTSPLSINVDVRGTPSGSRLVLDTVPAGGSTSNVDVLEQGDQWIFGFTSGGVDGGSVRVSRAKLAADGWRLAIPEAVVARLQSGPFVPAYR
jgi:hypothetical protein